MDKIYQKMKQKNENGQYLNQIGALIMNTQTLDQ